ncbi:GGDEF domain-containing phosphodiesterase [Butyrivibrio proteoclasticus]|uniref:GGDEF domain-containing phosphodiesterase n=1 Tax=Butyrivibrio proteoclasticus TaxID=43305 RepID=UPI00047D1494|nr:GGDEF domain-containing phosphodiesterase [Butyrivibrio proteoclasticus]
MFTENGAFFTIEEKDQLDELTGLQSLTGLLSHLQGHGRFAATKDTVVVYLNVMNFKLFNQNFGFSGGNEFLKSLALEIKAIFSDELAARAGGDQFIILSNTIKEDEIQVKFDQLKRSLIKYDKGLKMRLKAGVYKADGNEEDAVVMVDRAKIACDVIIHVYDKDINYYSEELNKENELRQYVIDEFEEAFKQKYFKVYYQREVRALTGKVCGYEALARWIDPKHGMISPAIFVEVLEDVHLIHKLDLYIIDQVCQDIRIDMSFKMAVEPISVNLSRLDFELCDILSEIDKIREKYEIPANLLNIEITESAVASGEQYISDHITRFREAGYQVWMDDFGAGYSSFNNLKTYNFDMLKIDMNFLRDFETNKRAKVILSTIVNMAKELGMHTLAEGVETQEQYDFLRRIGCERLQGYLFGKPKPTDHFTLEGDYSFDVCEDFKYNQYYDRIGEINVLGSVPLREKKMEVLNNLPIAIIETTPEAMTFLYANNAYVNFMSSLGITGVDEANKRNSNNEIPEVIKLREVMDKAEKSYDKRAETDIITSGSVINTKVRFIDRMGDRAAYALVSRNVTLHGEARASDNINVAMAHVFNQYFRVDLYDEDGTVENIFLNSDQLAVADLESDAVKAVEIYSNMYIHPEDKERFREFYRIPTVRDRIAKIKRDYVVDYFHSGIPGDGGRLQMYMILPFYYNDRWKYISLCRYADEISNDIIYGKS